MAFTSKYITSETSLLKAVKENFLIAGLNSPDQAQAIFKLFNKLHKQNEALLKRGDFIEKLIGQNGANELDKDIGENAAFHEVRVLLTEMIYAIVEASFDLKTPIENDLLALCLSERCKFDCQEDDELIDKTFELHAGKNKNIQQRMRFGYVVTYAVEKGVRKVMPSAGYLPPVYAPMVYTENSLI